MNIREGYTLEDTIEHDYIDYFIRLGFNPFVLLNKVDVRYYFDNIHIDGVVLTGGIDVGAANEMSQIRDATEIKILEYCIQNNIPVLGICRGMQMINSFFGGSLTQNISDHVRSAHAVCCINPLPSQMPVSDLLVNSYHNHGVFPHNLSSSLKVVFQNLKDGLIEGISHSQYPIFAIQWHPEREKTPNKIVDTLITSFFKNSHL